MSTPTFVVGAETNPAFTSTDTIQVSTVPDSVMQVGDTMLVLITTKGLPGVTPPSPQGEVWNLVSSQVSNDLAGWIFQRQYVGVAAASNSFAEFIVEGTATSISATCVIYRNARVLDSGLTVDVSGQLTTTGSPFPAMSFIPQGKGIDLWAYAADDFGVTGDIGDDWTLRLTNQDHVHVWGDGPVDVTQATQYTDPVAVGTSSDQMAWSLGMHEERSVAAATVGTASLSLSASGGARAAAVATAGLSLSGVGASATPVTGTASIAIAATGLASVAPPTGLTVTPISDDELLVNWDDYPTTVLYYEVERDSVVIARPAVSTYSDTGLDPATNYCYRIRAVL